MRKEAGIWIITAIMLTVVLIQTSLLTKSYIENGSEMLLKPRSFLLYDEIAPTPYEIGETLLKKFDVRNEIICIADYGGKNYKLIHYDNLLPFGERYDLVTENGAKVKDYRTAKNVISYCVWNSKEVIDKIYRIDEDELLRIKNDVVRIDSFVSPTYSLIHKLKDGFDRTKSIRLFGISLFDVITKDYRVSYIYKALSKLDEELGSWKQVSERCSSSIDLVLQDIQLLKSSGKVEPQKLENDFGALSFAINSYTERFYTISRNLETFIHYSEEAKRFISKYPEASFLIGYMDDVESAVRGVKSEVEGYADKISQQSIKIDEILSYAQNKENRYIKGYLKGFIISFLFGCFTVFSLLLIVLSAMAFTVSTDKIELIKGNIKPFILALFISATALFIIWKEGILITYYPEQISNSIALSRFDDVASLTSYTNWDAKDFIVDFEKLSGSSSETLRIVWSATTLLTIFTVIFWTYTLFFTVIRRFEIFNWRKTLTITFSFLLLHAWGYMLDYVVSIMFFPLLYLSLALSVTLTLPLIFLLKSRKLIPTDSFSRTIEFLISAFLLLLLLYSNSLVFEIGNIPFARSVTSLILTFVFPAVILIVLRLLGLNSPIVYLSYVFFILILLESHITVNGSLLVSFLMLLSLFSGFLIGVPSIAIFILDLIFGNQNDKFKFAPVARVLNLALFLFSIYIIYSFMTRFHIMKAQSWIDLAIALFVIVAFIFGLSSFLLFVISLPTEICEHEQNSDAAPTTK